MRVLFSSIALLSLSACSVVQGSGTPATETRTIEAFSGVSASTAVDADVRIGAASDTLELTCDDNLVPLIETVVEDGILRIRTAPEDSISPRTDCIVTVTTPELTSLTVSGAGAIGVDGSVAATALTLDISGAGAIDVSDLDVDDLDLDLSGTGSAELAGAATRAQASLSGTGRLNAEDLTVGTLDISISGAGGASITVTDTVEGSLSGTGGLEVFGGADVSGVSTSGTGRVTER